MADSVDVVVVGKGPAGEEVAGSLAERGIECRRGRVHSCGG